jgi:[1-hydroxy-2-(trimethylamino)ethyl]phosphonate dioxygenase
MSVSAQIRTLYERAGSAAYFGEPVSMLEHSLQTAHFATRARGSDAVIVAALLHDVGHLIEEVPEEIADWVSDAHHEVGGSRWLALRFGPEVYEPVRLHVPAKRYLCATNPQYFGRLSAASVHTLKLQGGPMSAAEVATFEAEPYYRDAVLVRGCDDNGKVADLKVADLVHYLPMIDKLARS